MNPGRHPTHGSVLWRYLVVLVLLLPAVLLKANRGFGGGRGPVVVAESTLPSNVGDWEGSNVPLSEDELSLLQSPAASQKIYKDVKTGEVVQVLLLQVDNTQNAHDPRICMRGSGYDLTRLDVIQAPWVGSGSTPCPVSRAVFSKDGLDITMFYWIQTPSGTIADMSAGFKLEGVMRALKGLSTKGVAVRVICLPNDGRQGAPTTPEAGQRLWKYINRGVDVERLVAGM